MSQPINPDPEQILARLNAAVGAYIAGQISSEDLAQTLAADQAFAGLVDALAGRQVQAEGTLISFGVGTQAGEIHFRDVAGRDLINIHIHINSGQVRIDPLEPAAPAVPGRTPLAVGSTLAPNPFGRRGRIDDPAEFFGREELLRRIFEELDKGSNLSLIGERQVGKSSLLAMIQRQGAAQFRLAPEALISIDMQLIHSEEDFFDVLCGELSISYCRGYKLARSLRGKRHILCLDEIEKMRRERFTADMRDELRGLADGTSAVLTLVIASSTPLTELFPDKLGEVSPLANICSPLDVPPFSRAEARAFLETRLRGTGVAFSADEIADLLEQSGRHPGRLQQLAGTLYQQKMKG